MLLVDTNVIADVLENDPEWVDWSIQQLRAQSQVYKLAINPIIYAELSLTFSTVEALDDIIAKLELSILEFSKPTLFLAGKAFIRYRCEGGTKTNVLADFFIGAQAAVLGYPLLTRDERRYRSYFPSVVLITPNSTK